MKRKLIKQGSGGLTLCVPKKWVDVNKLEAGDEVEVVEEKGNLLMSSSKIEKTIKRELIIDQNSIIF